MSTDMLMFTYTHTLDASHHLNPIGSGGGGGGPLKALPPNFCPHAFHFGATLIVC